MRTHIYKFLFLVTLGCANETSYKIEIREFSGNGYLNRTTNGNLVTKETGDSIKYLYTSDTLNYAFTFTKVKGEGDKLFYYNSELLFINKESLKIKGEEIEIEKYEFDDPTMSDEEASVFYIDNYGIISIKSDSWTRTTLFDRGQLEKDIFSELEKDTTGFYGYRPPPKQK
jgi:hypothetical protein